MCAIDDRIREEIAKCKRGQPSMVGQAADYHKDYIGQMLETTTEYQLRALVLEYKARISVKLRDIVEELING